MRLVTLHDILSAWQAGEIGYRRALQLAQIDTLEELYDSAHLSGVEIRSRPTAAEAAMAAAVGELIRSLAKPKAA